MRAPQVRTSCKKSAEADIIAELVRMSGDDKPQTEEKAEEAAVER
jgi:hypothetical protein